MLKKCLGLSFGMGSSNSIKIWCNVDNTTPTIIWTFDINGTIAVEMFIYTMLGIHKRYVIFGSG